MDRGDFQTFAGSETRESLMLKALSKHRISLALNPADIADETSDLGSMVTLYGIIQTIQYLNRGCVYNHPYVLTTPSQTNQSEFFISLCSLIDGQIRKKLPDITKAELIKHRLTVLKYLSKKLGITPWTLQGFMPVPEDRAAGDVAEELSESFVFPDEVEKMLFIHKARNFFLSIKGVDIKGGLERGISMKHGLVMTLARVNSGIFMSQIKSKASASYAILRKSRDIPKTLKTSDKITAKTLLELEIKNALVTPEKYQLIVTSLNLPAEHANAILRHYITYYYTPFRKRFAALENEINYGQAIYASMFIARITAKMLRQEFNLGSQIGAQDLAKTFLAEEQAQKLKTFLLAKIAASFPYPQEYLDIVEQGLSKAHQTAFERHSKELSRQDTFAQTESQRHLATMKQTTDLAVFIKSLRCSKGMNMAEFGRLVGVSIEAVRKWELKGSAISLQRAAEMSQKCDLAPEDDAKLLMLAFAKAQKMLANNPKAAHKYAALVKSKEDLGQSLCNLLEGTRVGEQTILQRIVTLRSTQPKYREAA